MSWRAAEAVEGFLEPQIYVWWGDGAASRWFAYVVFSFGEIALAECLCYVAGFGDTLFLRGKGR